MARITFTILLLLATALTASAADRATTFRLKPGATGSVCLGCHGGFADTLKKPSVHTPVRQKDCSGCHNPHTSSHGKLLADEPKDVCNTCHSGIVSAGAASVHKPVAEGKCAGCHDPHASGFAKNLVRNGNDLCFGCHADVAAATKAKFRHAPAAKNCLTCHGAHTSKNGSLLKNDVPALCLGCHKKDSPQFIRKHMNYPVAGSKCTSCHDPHGSGNPGILLATVHRPVLNRQCSQCHEEPKAGSPFNVKKSGIELCRSCHAGMLNTMAAKARQHWPLFSKKGCLTCHSPHAAPKKGLLRGDMKTVCGSCHADTIQRQERSVTKHQPIMDGECTTCHDPHSSDSAFLSKQGSMIDLCATCHDWQKHSTHPIGDKFRDPRNRNLTLQCLSCHRAHGTEYKHFIPFANTSELCTQCHDQYRR